MLSVSIMAYQAATASSECDANRHLFLAGGRASHLQAGQIGAHDQHHDAHCACKGEQSESKAAVHMFIERSQVRLERVSLGVLSGNASEGRG